MGRRLLQLRRGAASAGATYRVSLDREPAAGALVLRVDGHDTDPIGWSELDAATIQAALEDLPSVGPGGVSVTGSVALGFTLAFAAPHPVPSVTSNTLAEHVTDFDETLGPWAAVAVHTEGTDPTAEVATIYIPPGEIGSIQFVANGANSVTVSIDGSDDYAAALQSELGSMTAYLSSPPTVFNAGSGNYTVTWPAEAGDVPDLGLASSSGLSNPSVSVDVQGENGTSAREDVTLVADGGDYYLHPEPTEYTHPISAAAFAAAVLLAYGEVVSVNRVGSGPGYVYQCTFAAPGHHASPLIDIYMGGPPLYRAEPVQVTVT